VLYEIYFPAFKAAIQEAVVWSVMSAYNKSTVFTAQQNLSTIAVVCVPKARLLLFHP
jgi:beta-glucosidase-like glycosyl hydrolase